MLTEHHPGLDDLAEVLSCGGAICLERTADRAVGDGAADLAGLVAELARSS